MTRIYLDNAATSQPDPRVLESMQRFQVADSGNASSIHSDGVRASMGVEKARAQIAGRLHCRPDEIIFTSGGTESNNLALKGLAWNQPGSGRHILTTAIEHPSILQPCVWLQRQGFQVELLPVSGTGLVDPAAVAAAIRANTILVSVGHANHEIGAIQDIRAISRICQEKKVCFHSDACQSFTKVPCDLSDTLADLLTLNAHKIHGPKGIGALFIREGTGITPLLHGGGQEGGLRSGTLNTPAIAGFGAAATLATDVDAIRMTELRDYLIDRVEHQVDGVHLTGPRGSLRLCNHASFRVEGVRGKDLVLAMDKEDVVISAGSACSSGSEEPAQTLTALGLTKEQALSNIRLSLGRWTTRADLDAATECLAACAKKLRN